MSESTGIQHAFTGDHPRSYRARMQRLMFDAASFRPDRARLPESTAAYAAAEASA